MWSLGGYGIFSATMWKLVEPDDKWLWFSRIALGMIGFGFAGVMREIRKTRDKLDKSE